LLKYILHQPQNKTYLYADIEVYLIEFQHFIYEMQGLIHVKKIDITIFVIFALVKSDTKKQISYYIK
jgi:hypothetical protein